MSSRSFAYSGYDSYRGGAYFICDVCSQRFRRSVMLVEVGQPPRRRSLQRIHRPPQMNVPDIYPEGLPFPDARPPQDRPDRLEDDTALQSTLGGFQVQYGQTYPGGQNQQPGALSPLPFAESNDILSQDPEPGNPGIGTPIGPNVLADDVTFITGVIPAPDNTNSTTPDPVPSPNP